MTTTKQLSIFALEQNDDGVAVLRFNIPCATHNTITAEFGQQFQAMVEAIEADADIQALVLYSDKPGSFLAGADIGEMDQFRDASEIEGLSAALQAGFQRLSDLRVPVVAAIEGACLGGGLELALACDLRIVADSPKTTLG
ncbi:MAG: enoyl-CoA hydratase-related protein, partial [Salinisphaera sp.]|nr:enoyl-CoA hydratase-related protein [Salinisphaera sp.]